MEFYSNGSEMGVVFSGISGLLILSYLIIEIVSLIRTRMFLLHRLYIWFRVKKQIKNELPNYWYVRKVSLPKLKDYKSAYMYVSLERDLERVVSRITNDYTTVDLFGNIDDDWNIGVKRLDEQDISKEIRKKHNRDKKLEKLGI